MNDLSGFDRAISNKIIKVLWFGCGLSSIIAFALLKAPAYTKETIGQVIGFMVTSIVCLGVLSLLFRYKIMSSYLKYLTNAVLIVMVTLIITIMRNPEMFALYYIIMAINVSYRDRVLHLTSACLQIISYLMMAVFVPAILPKATAEDSTVSLVVTRITLFLIVALLIDILNHYTQQVRLTLVKQEEEIFRSALTDSSSALIQALEARDRYTQDHAYRTSLYAQILARHFRLSIPEEIFLEGCLLHDIGKIGITDEVLIEDKVLTEKDIYLIRKHPQIGASILAGARSLQGVVPMVLFHHERYDGGGYPRGIKGEAIPLEARILAVADAYDAMTSDRPYRKRFSPGQAYEEIINQSGRQFCPRVVDAFTGSYAAIHKINRRN